MSAAASGEYATARALLKQAEQARLAAPGPLENAVEDIALLERAMTHLERAIDAARANGQDRDAGLAWATLAQAKMRLPRSRGTVLDAERSAREALSLLDTVDNRDDALAAFVTLARALAEMSTVTDDQQRARIEAARGVISGAQVFALQAEHVLPRARLSDCMSRVLGERYRGGRDENLVDAVVIGEQALAALRAHHRADSLELPALLNHLGNCCVKIGIDHRDWLRRGQRHYREGVEVTDPQHYPRLRKVLEGNRRMVDGLLDQNEIHDALPEKEMVSRFAVATQDALDGGDQASAQAQALAFLRWAWSLPEAPNVHVGEAHKLLGRLAMAREALDEAESHFYQSALVLFAVLPAGHRWHALVDDAFSLFAQAMREAGRGELADQAAEQARGAWSGAREAFERGRNPPEEEAIASLGRALTLYPNFPPALLTRARWHYRAESFSAAMIDLHACLELRPRDLDALTLLAATLTRAEQPERALEAWAAVLAEDPNNRTALANRSQILQQKGQWAEARKDLDRLIEIEPAQAGAYLARATCRQQVGDLEGAIADLEQLHSALNTPEAQAELEQRIAQLRASLGGAA